MALCRIYVLIHRTPVNFLNEFLPLLYLIKKCFQISKYLIGEPLWVKDQVSYIKIFTTSTLPKKYAIQTLNNRYAQLFLSLF